MAALAVIALIAAGAGVVALVAQRGSRRRAAESASAARAAVWQVGEQGTPEGVEVFLCRVTGAGVEVDRIAVATVRAGQGDWESALLEARASAANRAALLNAPA